MTAYDYDRQRWVSGREAVRVRLHQIASDLELLLGPQGRDFAGYLSVNRRAAIKRLKREQRQLQRN